jgi:GntR family transcriptional repressor for pyruvate dehydrogenase complex
MQRVSLIDSIVEEIKQRISQGELKDGDSLGSQDDLAKRMEVSRPTLREALKRLELMGLIETKHGRGTFVKTITPQDFMNPLASFLVINQESAIELLEARLYIEGAVAALSAKNASQNDIKGIKKKLADMKTAAKTASVEKFIANDVQFHLLVAESSKNRVLTKVVNILRDLLHQLLHKVFEIQSDSLAKTFNQTISFHEKILSAIEQHNPDMARRHMEAHLKDVACKLK